MTYEFDQALNDITTERCNQLRRWGQNSHTSVEWLAIIMKQIGQASDAALKNEHRQYLHELTQAAACIVAALEDGLPEAGYDEKATIPYHLAKSPFQIVTEQLEAKVDELEDAVSYALTELGVDPSDWSDGKLGLQVAFACNKKILSGGVFTRDDWGTVEDGTLTAAIFDFVETR